MERMLYTKPTLEVVGELHDVTAGLNLLGLSVDSVLGGSSGGSTTGSR